MYKRLVLVLAAVAACAQSPALDSITPDALKGDLSFLASDALEGRATPSRGQDIAAEFIASRFRAAGLEPAGDDGYFQTAKMVLQKPIVKGTLIAVHVGGKSITVPEDK